MIQLVTPSRGHITQRYGNTQPDGMPHAGQDYAYSNGVEIFPEVFAAADGVVLFAGDSRGLGWPNPWYVNPDFNRADNWDSSAGNLITIRHGKIADTGYGHLEKCFVKAGDPVKAGQLIGIAGETGNSRGKHLHFFLMFHPFNYNTSTYGCSDPNPYFTGSLSYQGGTSTPLEEIDVAAEQNILARLQEIVGWQDAQFQEIRDTAERNRNALAGFVRDVVASGQELTEAELDAKFAELTVATAPAGALLYKGKESPEVYVWDGATGFRHIGIEEYVALTVAGANLRELDQEIINALPKEA